MEIESHITIPVTVDKSHITTIGERLYAEGIELVRELVNNAYDADATEVRVKIEPDRIEVQDDGAGLDLQGLRQYFSIGSPEKLHHNKSPVYKRDRIGQFGIGKFASLAACQQFVILSQKDDFAAQVTFDKVRWQESGDTWELPVKRLDPDRQRGNGTTVILSRLTRTFDPELVYRKILESVPLRAKHFSVFVNDRRVIITKVPGHRIPFLEGTEFGPVHGEIVIAPISQAAVEEMGVQVRVKGVTVKREYFGIQTWGKDGARIRGEANADFLLITSDRSGFRTDTLEYTAFNAVMQEVLQETKKQLGRLSDRRDRQRVSRALKEALLRIQQALGKHPDFIDAGAHPIGDTTDALGEPGETRSAEQEDGEPGAEQAEEVHDPDRVADDQEDYKKPKLPSPKIKQLSPNTVVRKISMGDFLVTCCLDYFGEDGPECFTEGQIIYINRDHPLYKRESKKKITHTMYLARLLTQEIALMKAPRDPRKAFERQSELLREAFAD